VRQIEGHTVALIASTKDGRTVLGRQTTKHSPPIRLSARWESLFPGSNSPSPLDQKEIACQVSDCLQCR